MELGCTGKQRQPLRHTKVYPCEACPRGSGERGNDEGGTNETVVYQFDFSR